jgi:hypothetical protein
MCDGRADGRRCRRSIAQQLNDPFRHLVSSPLHSLEVFTLSDRSPVERCGAACSPGASDFAAFIIGPAKGRMRWLDPATGLQERRRFAKSSASKLPLSRLLY